MIFTAAAVVFVPLFRKFHIGAILAYLFAGIIIGPSLTGLIKDPETILHFSELGVVFLLFIIGLELAPDRIWKLRQTIFGLGLLQVLLTGVTFLGIGLWMGFSFSVAYTLGFGLALSSTAFAIQMLEENHQLATTHGQGSFSVLMFQDLAVVPILASLSLFTSDGSSSISAFGVLRTIGILAVLIFLAPYLVRYVFRLVADSRAQEVFTAMSLLIVIGTALLVESIGLSMGMGAFLAGVLLANSEYRHELEINLMPFKGLLLGLFFMAIGMSLDLSILWNNIHWVALITVSFMSIKAGFIYLLARVFQFPRESARDMAITIPQGGEFAFVLFSAAVAKNILSPELSSILNASVTTSMALTPLIFSLNQRVLRNISPKSDRPFDSKIENDGAEVIIAGYGRFGQIVSRFLQGEGIKYTILEHSAAQVETARKFGSIVYYGDASRPEIIESAGAKDAKIFVLAIDDVEKSIETAKMVKQNFPHLEVIARVRNRQHALALMEFGITNIHRETYLTSLEVAKEVMLFKGSKRSVINKRLALFRVHDEEVLRQQKDYMHDEKKFISFTTKSNQDLQNILEADRHRKTDS